MRYNLDMARSRRLCLILVLVVVVFAVAAVLWLRDASGDTTSISPLPPSAVGQGSPLPTAMPLGRGPASLARAGVTLLWVVLGSALALGIALVSLRCQRGRRRRDV